MSKELFDASSLQAAFQKTHEALEAAQHAIEARAATVLPPLPGDRLYRHVITEQDLYYTRAMMSEPVKIPEAYVGMVAFSRRLMLPLPAVPTTNDILLQPLTPHPNEAQHAMLREQSGSKIVRIGIGWIALNRLELIPWGAARDEIDYAADKVFNPQQNLR
jgi:hypothetical protein